MSEKVKVSHRQNIALDEMKKQNNDDWFINNHQSACGYDENWASLEKLSVAELSKALYIGYEVEPEFKVGDWVVLEDGYIGEIEFINEVEEWANIGDSKDTKERGVCLAKTYDLVDIVRHATPEEIAAEKERRMDKKLDSIIQDLSIAERDQLYNKLMMMDVSE